jgi:predicted transcriptional regulator
VASALTLRTVEGVNYRAVEMWRGGVGAAYLLPALSSAGASLAGPCSVESVEELRRILTEKRLELLLAITRHRPASVHELAGLLGRDYKNVSTDITLLERLGLVRLEASASKGRAQIPTVPYDEIHVTIDLRQPREAHAA